MDIKKKLQAYDIKLVEFAELLKVSRPTLNSYINLHEKGDQLPNAKYQEVFNVLFSTEVEDKQEFIRLLDQYNKLLTRDEYLGVKEFDISSTNLLSSITDNIKKDLAKSGYDNDIYTFINMLVTSYRHEYIFQDFANYFLYLNGIKKSDDIKEDEKPFISNCFKFMSLLKKKKLETDHEHYSLFLDRITEIEENNKRKSKKGTQEIQKTLKSLLQKELKKKVQEQLNLGVDIDQIDFDELIQDIDLNEINK